MKKLVMALSLALACVVAFAQETVPAAPASVKSSTPKATWPVWLAFNSASDVDVVGLRMTLFYGKCESVTGFDLGFYGTARYFEGFQVNILRNEAQDVLSGCQVGIYNTAGRADLFGVQLGLFNEAASIRGCQVGIFNIANQLQGVQIGLVNRAESAYGFQGGIVNAIRDSELAFCPIVNVGFDLFPCY